MTLVDGLARDFRFALRLLAQTPVVSAVALLSLALGIGANVAVFSLVNALLVKTLPVHEPDRLVQLQLLGDAGPRSNSTSFTNVQWEYLRDQRRVFTGMAAVGNTQFNLGAGGEIRPASGLFVSGRYLETLGVVPLLGRAFSEDDDRRGGGGAGPVAVLGHGFWQREFGGDPSAVGRTISLDGHTFTVIGVTPPRFLGTTVGRAADVMVPIGTEPLIRGVESSLDRRSTWWLTVFGRLAPGQSLEGAEAELRALQPAVRQATMPADWRPEDTTRYFMEPFGLVPAATGVSFLRDRYSRPLLVLLGIVGLVLLIACANMANLLLAQASARRRELAVRLSLGASRLQLVRQLLVESMLLSGTGAAAGLIIAIWGSGAIVRLLSTGAAVVTLDLSLDWRVFAFTTAVGVLTGLLFGVAPAVQSTRVAPADALRDHARGVRFGGGRPGLGHALVVAQIAISFVLVCGASLFVRTLVSLTSQETGFDANRVMVTTLDLRSTVAAPEARLATFERVRDRVAAAPGIEAAALSLVTPMSGSAWNLRIRVPGYQGTVRDRVALYNGLSPDYFRTMGTPLLAGRDFSQHDTATSPGAIIVNEAFARKYFGGGNPVGRTFEIEGSPSRPARVLEVVGLVADAAYRSLRDPLPPTMYAPVTQEPQLQSAVRLAVRSAGEPAAMRATVLEAIASVDRDIAVELKPMAEDMNAAVLQERLVAALSSSFGGLALVLAALGLYGLMSYSVARRRNEIGIRIALGAEPRRLVGLVLGQVAFMTAAGVVAGVAAAAVAGRFVDALLFNLVATDRTMLVVTAVVLAAVAGLAGMLPARSAARMDPMTALRED